MLKFISRNAFLLRIILAPFLPSRKYVRPISKYKAHILKYVPCIFYFLRPVCNLLKMSDDFQAEKTDIFRLVPQPFLGRFNLKRSLGN